MLKVIMLRKKINEKKAELDALREAASDFQRREAELEADIDAAATEEEQKAVEEAVDAFEAEKKDNQDKQEKLSGEIAAAEEEIASIEAAAPAAQDRSDTKTEKREKEDIKTMENRTKFFGMSMNERDAFFARQDVKEFLQRVRDLGHQNRAITGKELLIPEVMLELVKETSLKYSKLIKHVNLRPVPGKARQNIMGAVPEAVWTEMCATLNELSLTFNQVEVDGYKVGGYIAVCNAILEDSDIALGTEIVSALGQAIGIALDKAILYGTGTKMPLGIVTRLAQTAAPADYPAAARPWADLHTSNIQTITTANSTGVKLFQSVIKASGAAKGKYSAGVKFWAMNEATYATMTAEALSINAAGAIASGMSMTMPIVGGAIEILDFIPDNNIIGGYGDNYLLAERAGTTLAQSEHVKFIEDQTVFKATARYDGTPVIAEAFIVLGIGNTTPTTSVSFTADTANTAATGGGEGGGAGGGG